MVPTPTGPSRPPPPPPPRPGPVYSPFAGHTVGGGKHGRIWPWKWHPLAFDWFLGPKPWKGKVGRQGTLRSPWWEKPHRRIGSNFLAPPPHFVVHGTRVPCARTRGRCSATLSFAMCVLTCVHAGQSFHGIRTSHCRRAVFERGCTKLPGSSCGRRQARLRHTTRPHIPRPPSPPELLRRHQGSQQDVALRSKRGIQGMPTRGV